MTQQLFSLVNVDKTREKFMSELGLGINLPVLHMEEIRMRGTQSLGFVSCVYAYNKRGSERGLYAVSGKYDWLSGKTEITEIGIMTVWNEWNWTKNKNFYFTWLCENIAWMPETVKWNQFYNSRKA